MNKLRSDSPFSQLTPEQMETLEEWLFEERLGYKEALERMQNTFGVAVSQSGLARFYARLATERSQIGLVEIVGACAEATGMAKSGTLEQGLLTLGNKCAVELLIQSPGKVREFTALLRALTSAQGQEIRRVQFQREQERWKKG
jgi:hypothetical protein